MGNKSRRKWSDEQLIAAVRETTSMRQTLLRLGLCARGGGSYDGVKRRILELKISTEHWLGLGHRKGKSNYCGKVIEDSLVFCIDSHFCGTSLKKRLLRRSDFEYKCLLCGIYTWNNKHLVLQLDHINGINTDNRVENLRLLCPNCHSQTETFCRKKKGDVKKINVPVKEETKTEGRTRTPKRCSKCSENIHNRSTLCGACYNAPRETKIIWPSNSEIRKMLTSNSYLKVAEMLGVSDNAIRKHLKRNE